MVRVFRAAPPGAALLARIAAGVALALICLWAASQGVAAAMLRGAVGSLRGRVVVIDPGHGGIDPGAVGVYGLSENRIVVPIAEDLAVLIEHAGATVVLTRRRGEGGGRLQDRIRRAREAHGDVLVSIHGNQYWLASEHGATVLYAPASEASRRLADILQGELAAITAETRRSTLPRPNLYLLKHAPSPAVIVEVGFLSNARDARLLGDSVYQRRLAWAMFVGLAKWFAAEAEPGPARAGQGASTSLPGQGPASAAQDSRWARNTSSSQPVW